MTTWENERLEPTRRIDKGHKVWQTGTTSMSGSLEPALLRPTIVRAKGNLPVEVKRRIAGLRKPAPIRFLAALVQTWLVIGIAICVARHAHSAFVTVLTIVFIAGQQNKLALLLHEQTHYLGLRSGWGDFVTNLFAVWPLLAVSLPGYARIHLAHHKRYLSNGDPDAQRKKGGNWVVPMSRGRLALLFAADLAGLTVTYNAIGKSRAPDAMPVRRMGPALGWVRVVYILLCAYAVTITDSWALLVTYWIVPLATVLQAFIRLGALCEHVYVPNAPLETSTPLIIPTWWEGLIFPHLNFFYHIYHHYHPQVRWVHVPKIHRWYVEAGLVDERNAFRGIWRYINAIVLHDRIVTDRQ